MINWKNLSWHWKRGALIEEDFGWKTTNDRGQPIIKVRTQPLMDDYF